VLRHNITGRFEYIFIYKYFWPSGTGVIDISADDTTI